MSTEKPYIVKHIIVREFKYNPNYGDDRWCECGHVYYRHFDTYENMYACGCKYCGCQEFKEATPEQQASFKKKEDERIAWIAENELKR